MGRALHRWGWGLLLGVLAPVAGAASLEVLPPGQRDVPALGELASWRRAGGAEGRRAEELGVPEALHVLRGGERARFLGEGRVVWGDRRFELVVVPEPDGRGRRIALLDHEERRWSAAARIPAPSGGEPRVHLSDRDGLVAVTVDFGTWDTCPVLLSLEAGAAREIPLPCPAAGRAALAALERKGVLRGPSASQARFQLRLTNVRFRDPSFLRAEEVLLDAEIHMTGAGEVHPARFVLREGEVVRCRLQGEPGGPDG